MEKKRIVILGAGFAGLFAALHLQKELGRRPDTEVLLIDRNNYSTFTPLLPEVVSGALGVKSVARQVRCERLRFLRGEIGKIDLTERKIRTGWGEIGYDYLVIALGSVADFGPAGELQKRSFTLQSLSEALGLKNRIVESFEKAAVVKDPEERKRLLTFVVVGGGPRGVEVAAEIQNFVRGTLCPQYELGASSVRTVLVHGGERLLPNLSPSASRIARERLQSLGAAVRLSARIAGYDGRDLLLEEGEGIPTRTLVWLAGFRSNPVPIHPPLEREEQGRIRVKRTLEVPGYEGVYAAGDIAHLLDEGTGQPYPLVSRVALLQGVLVARNIARALQGRDGEPFRYCHRRGKVSLGTGAAVIDFSPLIFDGVLGWWIYGVSSLLRLPGFRNKMELIHAWFFNSVFGRDIYLVTAAE
jgi:NADH dehydrogenase